MVHALAGPRAGNRGSSFPRGVELCSQNGKTEQIRAFRVLTRAVTSVRRQARVRAPELTGDVWLNTGGEKIQLADLRGRIVLLDFWTSGCVNCLHVLDE